MIKPLKILIAEDEAVIAMDLEMSLEKFGYLVTGHVMSGEEAIRSVQVQEPDLVLMDIKLEGNLDGIETAKIIRQSFQIPVIFITSYSTQGAKNSIVAINDFGYIIKPFTDRELFTIIQKAISKQRNAANLHESEHKVHVTDHKHIYIECDMEGTITHLDETGRKLLHLSSEEIENGTRLGEFILHGSFALLMDRLLHSKSHYPKILNEKYLLRSRNGEEHWVEEYLYPVYEDDQVSGLKGALIKIKE